MNPKLGRLEDKSGASRRKSGGVRSTARIRTSKRNAAVKVPEAPSIAADQRPPADADADRDSRPAQVQVTTPAVLYRAVASRQKLEPQKVPENIGGIASSHIARLRKIAQKEGLSLMIGKANPDALKWHIPGITTKPTSLKVKSQRVGHYAGLVTDPTHPNIKAQWREAEQKAREAGDLETARRIRMDFAIVADSWRTAAPELEQKGYAVDREGRLFRLRPVADGFMPTFLHADYDLIGVWSPKEDGSQQLLDLSGSEEALNRMLSMLNTALGRRAYFRHGAFFDPSYQGRELRGDAVLITPDGSVIEIGGAEHLLDVTQERSMDLVGLG